MSLDQIELDQIGLGNKGDDISAKRMTAVGSVEFLGSAVQTDAAAIAGTGLYRYYLQVVLGRPCFLFDMLSTLCSLRHWQSFRRVFVHISILVILHCTGGQHHITIAIRATRTRAPYDIANHKSKNNPSLILAQLDRQLLIEHLVVWMIFFHFVFPDHTQSVSTAVAASVSLFVVYT